MDADAWLVGHEPRERSTLESDQIDVNARVGERARVILHPSTASEIGQGDDDSSHLELSPARADHP